MRQEIIARFEEMKVDCSTCPIAPADCEWMADTFQHTDKPSGKAEKWCPLLITIGNIMSVLGEPGERAKSSAVDK